EHRAPAGRGAALERARGPSRGRLAALHRAAHAARRAPLRRHDRRRRRGPRDDDPLRLRARAVRREARHLPGGAADGGRDGDRARGSAARDPPGALAPRRGAAGGARGCGREGVDGPRLPRGDAHRPPAPRRGGLRDRARAAPLLGARQGGRAALRLDRGVARGACRRAPARARRGALALGGETAMRFGIHAGPQDCSIADLRRLWRIADERGFHWCSVWDHLYSVSDLSNPAKPAFEGVAAMAALASETRRVRVGCLVFCVCYRSPGVLAKAAVTIDHLSGGRCELGIGAGWNELEARAFGVPFGSIGARLDLLEETAIVLRRLFDGERVTFEGRHVQLHDALCDPRPVQPRLRLWIAGQGEKRMLRIVARHADGWNVPFLAPEQFAQRNATLDRWCERERRDPRAIVRTVNLGLAIGEDADDVK